MRWRSTVDVVAMYSYTRICAGEVGDVLVATFLCRCSSQVGDVVAKWEMRWLSWRTGG